MLTFWFNILTQSSFKVKTVSAFLNDDLLNNNGIFSSTISVWLKPSLPILPGIRAWNFEKNLDYLRIQTCSYLNQM